MLYSGPLPPSGGVKRPPLAVMAPHCTQLEGLVWITFLPDSSACHSSTAAGHMLIQASPTASCISICSRRWEGCVSRLRLPLTYTLESLSKVRLLSGLI